MQQLGGLILIIAGIVYFLFAIKRHKFDLKDYDTVTTSRRYKASFLMVLLGIILLLELIIK